MITTRLLECQCQEWLELFLSPISLHGLDRENNLYVLYIKTYQIRVLLLEPEFVNKNCIAFFWVFDTVPWQIENQTWSKARCANPAFSQKWCPVIFVPCCVQNFSTFHIPEICVIYLCRKKVIHIRESMTMSNQIKKPVSNLK
jgi:hypothetical protein